MFDGNHRSRRNANVGSRRVRSRRTTTGGATIGTTQLGSASNAQDRASLLARTEQLRNERRIEKQRKDSAQRIQRYYRGYCTRKVIIQQCLNVLQQQQQQPAATTMTF